MQSDQRIDSPHSVVDDEEEGHVDHSLPRGALVMTLVYLVLLTTLWMQVYLILLARGGVGQ